MAKYMFLQFVDESATPRPGSPEMQAVIDAFASYLEDVKKAGAFVDGDPFQPSAATFSVTAHNGNTKTADGPVSRELPWLNGYFVLDCENRDEAESWAARNPAARVGIVEVHPILKL